MASVSAGVGAGNAIVKNTTGSKPERDASGRRVRRKSGILIYSPELGEKNEEQQRPNTDPRAGRMATERGQRMQDAAGGALRLRK